MGDFIEDFKFMFLEGGRWKFMLDGLKVTIGVSVASMFVGLAPGLAPAIIKTMAVKKNRRAVLSVIASIYVGIIRGMPSILQPLIMYFVMLRSRMGIMVAIISFSMNNAAYVTENTRAGVMAVDQGQMESGRLLGLSYGIAVRYIIIPQAVKNILPTLGNEFILLIKETSILGCIAIYDLTEAVSYVTSRIYKMFLPLIEAVVIYCMITKTLSIGLAKFERRLRESD